MIWLLLGGVALFCLMGGLRAFERADVRTIKAFGAWMLALGGAALAVLLLLTGKGMVAISGLALFGPLIWEQWRRATPGGAARAPLRPSATPMTEAEALAVLGLRPGATEAEVLEAWKRVMRGAHPDAGGSDWLASRVNQARDILVGSARGRRGRT